MSSDFTKMYDQVRTDLQKTAPGLKDYWGVSICTVDGQRWCIGDSNQPHTLQSASAALNYAIAITQLGKEAVHKYVGKEATSDGKMDLIEIDKNGLPHNALVQAGSIAITSLMLNTDPRLPTCFDDILNTYRKLSG